MDKYPMLHIGLPEQFSEAPPGSYAYKLELEEAKDAEAVMGLCSDLNYVVKLTQLLVRMEQQGESAESIEGVREVHFGAGGGYSDDNLIKRALWEAALVAYARCFHKGKRKSLNESVLEGQDEEMLVYHRYFKDTRDKHIAHSVNPFESFVTGAYLADLDSNPRLTGVFNMEMRRAGEHVSTVQKLERLATYIRENLEKQRQDTVARLHTAAKTLSPEELKRLPVLEFMPEQGFDVAKKKRR